MVPSSWAQNLRFDYVAFWFIFVRYVALRNNYVVSGLQKHVFLIKSDIHHFFVRSNNVWKWRSSYVEFQFLNLLNHFFCQNYIFNAFFTIMYFSWPYENIFCDILTLRVKITFFVRHCEVFFGTSQLRSLFVRCSYVFSWR